ncbi:MAG: hypothetical protein JO022_10135, partial [Acidobacteriaceae bacterium]|nr:hypothetical protein [Acidobacteriaceae bacterium]
MREEFGIVQPAPATDAASILAAARAEAEELSQRVTRAAHFSAQALATLQYPQGYWQGKLTADTTLESDYVLLLLWLYPPRSDGWNPPLQDRIRKALGTILDRQLADGGWNIYANGPSDVNATARAYTALKLCGYHPSEPLMRRARERVLALGGLQAANSYTKMNFSLFGLYPRQFTPSVPPELVLIPGNLLYEMSSWTRAIVVPLSIVQAIGGERPVPAGFNVEELYVPGQALRLPKKDRISAVFNQADRVVKLWERRGVKDIRAKAIREAEKWMLDHTRYSDGLGAIYPSMMYAVMAM